MAKRRTVQVRTAERAVALLDRPIGFLGIVFLFVVLGQLLITDPSLSAILGVAGWVFWGLFVAEFLLRAYLAGFQAAFWRRNWWQVIFLLVPFLRFFRALQTMRLARLARFSRAGGIVSAGVRGSRSAKRLLSGRLGWLASITAVIILASSQQPAASSQLLYASGSHPDYSTALYEAALATITGDGITTMDAFSRILQVILAIYSVVVFATLAGSLGAYFLRENSTVAVQGGEELKAGSVDQPAPGSR